VATRTAYRQRAVPADLHGETGAATGGKDEGEKRWNEVRRFVLGDFVGGGVQEIRHDDQQQKPERRPVAAEESIKAGESEPQSSGAPRRAEFTNSDAHKGGELCPHTLR
jgi:hypothetical protein